MANYDLSYTGPQVETAIGRALNPDTSASASSSNLITGGAVAAAVADEASRAQTAEAALSAAIAVVGGLRQSQVIATGTDLDSIDTTGVYHSPNGATSQSLVHCPVTNAFSMLVLSRGSSRLQVVFNGSMIHSRTVGGNWYKFAGEVV